MNLTEREAPKTRLQPLTKKNKQDHKTTTERNLNEGEATKARQGKETNETKRKKPNREGTFKDKATTPHKETNKTTAERNLTESKAPKTRLQRPIKPIPHKLVQSPLESLE